MAPAAITQSEASFQDTVIGLAHVSGWRVLHVRRSRVRADRVATATSIAGWPDLFLFNPKRGEHLAVELKSERGALSPDQKACLADLEAAGVEVHVWRPRHWDEIVARLSRGPL